MAASDTVRASIWPATPHRYGFRSPSSDARRHSWWAAAVPVHVCMRHHATRSLARTGQRGRRRRP
eukprot:5401650-Prymnesium_polylepis.1